MCLVWHGVQVQGVCKGIMQMLGTLAGEYEELLKRIAVKQEPLAIGQELQVGQLPEAGPSQSHCSHNAMLLWVMLTLCQMQPVGLSSLLY